MSGRSVCKGRSWQTWVSAIVLLLQPCTTSLAATVAEENLLVASVAPVGVQDIALKRGGILQGQVVNHGGVGKAGATVELTSGRQHWQTKTDAEGWFQVAGLRGGSYQFRAAEQTQVLRVWAAGTAPPSASQGVLVTPLTEIVRGQRFVSPNTNRFFSTAKQRLANPWIFGGVVATAVAIPVAIHNADDEDPPATP